MLNDEKKHKIMFWDDAGFWMHTPDTFEKIEKDAERLLTRYLNRPRPMFTGIYELFNDAIATRVFLMKFLMLIKRVERLAEKEKSK